MWELIRRCSSRGPFRGGTHCLWNRKDWSGCESRTGSLSSQCNGKTKGCLSFRTHPYQTSKKWKPKRNGDTSARASARCSKRRCSWFSPFRPPEARGSPLAASTASPGLPCQGSPRFCGAGSAFGPLSALWSLFGFRLLSLSGRSEGFCWARGRLALIFFYHPLCISGTGCLFHRLFLGRSVAGGSECIFLGSPPSLFFTLPFRP